MDGVGYRIAPRWTSDRINCRLRVGTIRRAVAQRDIQLFEMEEAFGWPWWVRRAISIPICVRLHGPWFLNSPALGLPKMRSLSVGSSRRDVRSPLPTL